MQEVDQHETSTQLIKWKNEETKNIVFYNKESLRTSKKYEGKI